MDDKQRAGIMAVLARMGSMEQNNRGASHRFPIEERRRQEAAQKGVIGGDINHVLQAAGIAPRPGPTAGVPRDMNAPQDSMEAQAIQSAQAIASNPGLSHIVGQPRDPNVIPTEPRNIYNSGSPLAGIPRDPTTTPGAPRTPMYQPRDPNVVPTDPRATYNPKLGADRAQDPRMSQGIMSEVYNQAQEMYGPKPTTTPAAPGVDPRLSADRGRNLSMLYKGDIDKKKDEKPKKQWVVPANKPIPAGYHVVGDDGRGGQIVEEGGETPKDPKTEAAANQSYVTTGASVASAAAPIVYNYLTAAPAAAATTAAPAAATVAAPAVATAAAPAAATGAAATGAGVGASSFGAASGVSAAAPYGTMLSASGEAIGTAATAQGAGYAGAGATATGTSTLASMGMVAWPLAVLYAAYRVGSKIHEKKKKGSMTESDIHMSLNPRGIESKLQEIPGHRKLKQYSPEFQVTKALFGSTKGDDQLYRDRVRKSLKANSFIDENYNLTLADGTTFDIGKDGSVQNYKVDNSSPETGEIIGSLDPLAHLITAPYGNEKLKSDYTGMFTNAVLSGSPDQQLTNIQGLYQKAGLDRDSSRAGVEMLFSSDTIDEGTRDAYFASIDRVFGVDTEMTPYNAGGESGGGGGGSKKPKPESDPKPTPKPAPTLASIIPQNPPPPVMPEPDDEKTPAEQQAVNDYETMLGVKPVTPKKKEKKPTKRYTYGNYGR